MTYDSELCKIENFKTFKKGDKTIMNNYEKSLKLLEKIRGEVAGKLYFNRYLFLDNGYVIDIGDEAYLTKCNAYYDNCCDSDVPNGTRVIIYIPASDDVLLLKEALEGGCGLDAWISLEVKNDDYGVVVDNECFHLNCNILTLSEMHILNNSEIVELNQEISEFSSIAKKENSVV